MTANVVTLGLMEHIPNLVLQGMAVVEDFMRSNPISSLRVERHERFNDFLLKAGAIKKLLTRSAEPSRKRTISCFRP